MTYPWPRSAICATARTSSGWGWRLYEIKPTPVQLQRDQERRQLGGDFRRFFNSFIQGGGSLVQRGASLIQIGGSSLQFGGSSRGALHAKTFVLDRQTVFVGSFNFDPRSMRLDTQNGIVIRSPELADQAACAVCQGRLPRSHLPGDSPGRR